MSHELSLWIKKLLATGIILVVCYCAYITRDILFLLVIAGFITIMVTPLVEKWKKYNIPDWLSLIVVYCGIIFLASIVIVTIIPIVINFFTNVITQVSHWSENAQVIYEKKWIEGFNLPKWLEHGIMYFFNEKNIWNTIDVIKQNAGTIQNFLTSQVSNITSGGITLVSTIGWAITNWIFIGIATFFMVLERASIGKLFIDVTPDKYERYIREVYKKIQVVCVSWIKASALLSASIFLLTYFGLTIAESLFGFKTENTFTLALISGIMEFIPYVGPILSLVPALIIALGISWDATVVVLVLYIIIQQIENNFLVPFIMSRNLDISPLFVFIIMLFGTSLWGIAGIILSVPIAGIIKVLYVDALERRKLHKKVLDVKENIFHASEKEIERENEKSITKTIILKNPIVYEESLEQKPQEVNKANTSTLARKMVWSGLSILKNTGTMLYGKAKEKIEERKIKK